MYLLLENLIENGEVKNSVVNYVSNDVWEVYEKNIKRIKWLIKKVRNSVIVADDPGMEKLLLKNYKTQ